MIASIELATDKPNQRMVVVIVVVVVSVANKPKLFGAGKGPDLGSEGREPRRSGVAGVLLDGFGAAHQVVPRWIRGQVGKDLGDNGWVGLHNEFAAVLHLSSVPPPTLGV